MVHYVCWDGMLKDMNSIRIFMSQSWEKVASLWVVTSLLSKYVKFALQLPTVKLKLNVGTWHRKNGITTVESASKRQLWILSHGTSSIQIHARSFCTTQTLSFAEFLHGLFGQTPTMRLCHSTFVECRKNVRDAMCCASEVANIGAFSLGMFVPGHLKAKESDAERTKMTQGSSQHHWLLQQHGHTETKKGQWRCHKHFCQHKTKLLLIAFFIEYLSEQRMTHDSSYRLPDLTKTFQHGSANMESQLSRRRRPLAQFQFKPCPPRWWWLWDPRLSVSLTSQRRHQHLLLPLFSWGHHFFGDDQRSLKKKWSNKPNQTKPNQPTTVNPTSWSKAMPKDPRARAMSSRFGASTQFDWWAHTTDHVQEQSII